MWWTGVRECVTSILYAINIMIIRFVIFLISTKNDNYYYYYYY